MRKISIQSDGVLLAQDAADVRSYFEKVIGMSQNCDENEFIVELDEVWPLAYSRKDKCVRALKKDFIEGVDYIIQSISTGVAGRTEEKYMISLKCMEFLVARKVRGVFEVYRQVFHKAVNHLKMQQDNHVPFHERTRKNGWYCLNDLNSNQLFYLFQMLAQQELKASPKTDAEKERDWVLAHFPIALSLVSYLNDSFSMPCATSAELHQINRILSGARTWYENHLNYATCYPAEMDYTPFGCAKAMMFKDSAQLPRQQMLLTF